MPWYRSLLILLVTSLAIPPLGLVLLWMRTGTRLIAKLAGTLLIAAVTLAHLFLLWGLRIEMAGSGIRPLFTFTTPDRRDARVEENRAAMRHSPPPDSTPAAAAPAGSPLNSDSTYWSDFRGPGRVGVYQEMPILTAWPSAGLPRLWKQPVGGGYASLVVAQGLAFTIEQRRDQEVVAAYDLLTGREKWTSSWKAQFRESMGGDGPRATPVWDDTRLYALGAEGELRCLDASTGTTLWRKNILEDNDAANLTWGMSNAPLVVDGKLIVLP